MTSAARAMSIGSAATIRRSSSDKDANGFDTQDRMYQDPLSRFALWRARREEPLDKCVGHLVQ